MSTKRTFPHLPPMSGPLGVYPFDGPEDEPPSGSLCPKPAGGAAPLLRPRPSAGRQGGYGRPGGRPPTWKGLRSPRNGLQWSVNGQILACHITGDEKMSVCFLYLMQKNYLNLWIFFLKKWCVLAGREGGPVLAEGTCVWWPDFCALPYCGSLNPFQMGLSFLFFSLPPTPFSYFTCCDFTEPFQLVVNSSFVPGPSVNSACGSPGLTTHRNRLSKQCVSGPQTQQVS